MSVAKALRGKISTSAIGRLTAVLEQVIYTGFALFVFVLAIAQYATEKSAANLALIAILNLPVPFHAIQIGWQSEAEKSFWLGSMPLQFVLYLVTAGSLCGYMLSVDLSLDGLTLAGIALAAFVAVWSNGLRWIMIKRGAFHVLIAINLASLATVISIEFFSIFSGFLSLFYSVVVAKAVFTIALIAESKIKGGLTFAGGDEGTHFDLDVAILALSRFMRTNGVFTIMTVFAPSAAIVGRLVQQAIAICRVFQNPLANFTFFHERSYFKAMIRMQIVFGIGAAALFFIVSTWYDGEVPPLLGSLAVLCATLGFIGIFVMRHQGRKQLGIVFETMAAAAFLGAVLLAYESQGFIIGLILSEVLLFAGGLWALKTRRDKE